ncbi:hypothetical protein A0H81_02402 [Grifola frondosa]|uniref:YAP1-binding protein 2 n=1 Tax=Grifola frondosa TaxID=5627 RepID=A0A1C7ML57_GRIFR|nr:hypothetical protein A0H81_02402 [Grifola frondosa]
MDTLKEVLGLDHWDLDEDPGVALTSLILSAIREDNPQCTLTQISLAINKLDSASFLEPLTVLPLLSSSLDDGASEIITSMGKRCNAKEVVMATQEAIESLERHLQTEDEDEQEPSRLSTANELSRLLRLYGAAIPRLPKRKKLPSETLKPLLSELESTILLASHSAAANDGRLLILSVSLSITLMFEWVGSDDTEERSKVAAMLYHLLSSTIEVFASTRDASFIKLCLSRYGRCYKRCLDDNEETRSNCSHMRKSTSLGSLILLAHSPSYLFSIPHLTTFFPIVLTSIQSSVALDEVLSLLITSFAPLHSQSPRPDLPPDLIVPLIHILPYLASSHPDPSTRHQTFKLISVILALTPSPLRLRLLHDLLTDSDLPPQMRVAAVGLVKDAVLEALVTAPGSTESNRNVFASFLFLRTLGPAILRTDPPDLLNSSNLRVNDFLETSEPLRLVECLAFYYVLLQRDTSNRTGVRDLDSIMNVQETLLYPLRRRFTQWDLDTDGPETSGDHAAMQLGILDMWLERVQGTSDDILQAHSAASHNLFGRLSTVYNC